MMKRHLTQFGSIAFVILSLMMGPNVYAYHPSSMSESSLNDRATVADPIETETEWPSLVFAEEAGHSFLSRVFSTVLQSENQDSTQGSETDLFPAISLDESEMTVFEDEMIAASPRQSASSPALRFVLLFGALGISWGLIALLAFRLLAMKHRHSEQTIETETITSTGYHILGDIAMKNRKFQLAEQCYRKIAEKESYNKEIHYDIGKALFQAERYQDAIREFQIALGCEIVSTDIYAFLAKAYQAVNQPERAVQYSQKAMQFKAPKPVAPRKKDPRNVIPLQKRLKGSKVPRQAHKLSA